MKQFIKDNLFILYKNKIGLNGSRLKKSWFINNKYLLEYKNILICTNFLFLDCTLSERIYCIINNIKEHKLCLYCNEYCKYVNFEGGYKKHCGSKNCIKKYKSTFIIKDGLTPNQLSGKGISIAMNTIQENGKSLAVNIYNFNQIKRNKILENGKTLNNIIAEKSAKTKMTTFINNEKLSTIYARKSNNTMKNRFINNESIQSLRIKKMIKTKSTIGLDGLDSWERGFKNGAGKNSSIKYFNDLLYYQGSYEKYFLDLMYNNNLISIVERGPRFNYNINKQYRSDYKVNKYIIEIKSSWSYGAENEELRNKNILKFKAVLNNLDYKLIVIFNNSFFIIVDKNIVDSNLFYNKLYHNKIENLINVLTK